MQDLVDWQCFACGRLNERGLKVKSTWEGDELVCTWHPDPLYVGHPGWLHAGLVATVMMCHVVWAATALAHRRLGREVREPFPLHHSVGFRARVQVMEGEHAKVACSAYVDGAECARGEAELMRFVP